MNYHSEILLKIEPVGEKLYRETHLLKNVEISDCEYVDDLFQYGNVYNSFIIDAVNNSKYNMLDNWNIEKISSLSDSDLGIRWALNNSNRLLKKKKKEIY